MFHVLLFSHELLSLIRRQLLNPSEGVNIIKYFSCLTSSVVYCFSGVTCNYKYRMLAVDAFSSIGKKPYWPTLFLKTNVIICAHGCVLNISSFHPYVKMKYSTLLKHISIEQRVLMLFKKYHILLPL